MNKGNFKKLVRTLRKKTHEKLVIQRDSTSFISRKEGEKDNVRSTEDSDPRPE